MKTVSAQAFELLSKSVEKGWTISAIAKASGVSRVGLQRWYNGTRGGIDAKALDGLCQWLGVELTKATIPKPVQTHHRKPTKKKAGK